MPRKSTWGWGMHRIPKENRLMETINIGSNLSGGLPPVGAFWSITAYNAIRFLIENPIDRYVINSPCFLL